MFHRIFRSDIHVKRLSFSDLVELRVVTVQLSNV